MDAAIVHAILVYPIKGIAPLRLDEAEVDGRGFTLDRRWLVVDQHGKRPALHLRQRLLRVVPELSGDGNLLTLSTPAMDVPLVIPMHLEAEANAEKVKTAFGCSASVVPGMATAWFSKLLEIPCRLVRMLDEDRRAVRADAGRPGDTLNFSDLSAIHALNLSSLEDLNLRIDHRQAGEAVSVGTFRPNLVLGDCAAYAEDGWVGLRGETVRFDTGIPCPRCSMTLLDPVSGERRADGEPLKTLTTYRRDAANAVNFGQYFAVRRGGRVRVGEKLVAKTS